MAHRVLSICTLVLLLSLLLGAESWGAPGLDDTASDGTGTPSSDSLPIKVSKPPATGDAGEETYVPGQLIIKFKEQVGDAQADSVMAQLGILEVEQLLLPGYSLISLPPDTDLSDITAKLLQDPSIELVERNWLAHADFTPNDPYYRYQWHFPLIQMPQAWDLSKGNGVIVAVVDTGVAYENYGPYRKAPDLLSSTFVPGYDFFNNDNHPNDDNYHGTHVAGTIAQATNNHLGVAGVADQAKIMPVKVLNSSGTGPYSAVANGIIYAADHGAKVINLSLGGPGSSLLLEDAVEHAHDQGSLVVASTGNDNGPVSYPARYAKVLAVGSVRYDLTRAWYSNYGVGLDLVAPGGDLNVDQNGDGYPDGVLQQTFALGDPTDFGYWFFEGTSMAAPHVSGVAAQIMARGIVTNPSQVRQAILVTTKHLGTPVWDQYTGSGLVQAYDALGWIPSPTPVPPGPYRSYLPSARYYSIDDP